MKEFTKAIRSGDFETSLKIIEKWMSPSFPLCSPKIINKKFPFILSSTVSTQLPSPIAGLLRFNPIPIPYDISNFCLYLTQKHVNQITELLEDGGMAVLISEQYEWGFLDSYGNLPIMEYVNEPEQMLEKEVQNKIEHNSHYVTGRITEENLYTAGLNIISSSEWIWNILGNRHYLVKGWIVQK